MTDNQLSLLLELIAGKIESELLPAVVDTIFTGERETYTRTVHKWVGEGSEPFYDIFKSGDNYETTKTEIEGDLKAKIVIEEFAYDIRVLAGNVTR